MDYPGNEALSEDIKERIVSTFRQTVETARKGNHKEALLGCDFILKLDPEFAPAQRLQERLQEPPAVALTPKVGLPGPTARLPAEELVEQLRSLLAARRFEEALGLAQKNAAAVSAHATLQVLAQEAQSRLEAEPYIQSFLEAASQALEEGETGEVRKHLAKASALDPKHPRLLELTDKVEAQAKVPEPGGAFTFDLEEPVRNFTLQADPLSIFATTEEESPGPLGVTDGVDSLATEADSFSGLSDPSDSASAKDLGPLDDPLAAFAVPIQELPPTQEHEEDPFAALSVSSLDAAVSFETDASAEAAEIEDDPFAAFSANEAVRETKVESPSSGDDRVSDLLAEGQAAFDRRDHQGAIDAWSRIFLIDIDNEEASRRIEAARQLKAESERQVEEIYHEGLEAWKNGSAEEAIEAFERVVAIEPNHGRAQEHLERLAAGEGPDVADVLAELTGSDLLPPAPGSSLLSEVLVPPEPGETPLRSAAAPPVEPSVSANRGSRINRKFVLIALAVLLAAGAGAGYLFSNRDAFFPNSERPPQAQGPEAPPATPLDRARKLHEGGKTKLAIAQLKRLPENHPSYEEAQQLLADWSGSLTAPEEEAPAMAGELANRRGDLVREAQFLESQGEFLRVQEALAAAAEIAPLEGEEAALMMEAEERLAPLQSEVRALAERDWDFALKSLWRKHTADPGNRDVVRLLVNCYYNMALRDLQRGNQGLAIQNLDEALALAPDDEEASRHRSFAQAYLDSPTDLLFRIYVKYLPYR